jgi:hypothetical protein
MNARFLVLLLIITAGWLAWPTELVAQCAMCRQSVESNLSNGGSRIGTSLNTGILYLMSLPYLIFVVVGYLWYRASRTVRAKKLAIAAQLKGMIGS